MHHKKPIWTSKVMYNLCYQLHIGGRRSKRTELPQSYQYYLFVQIDVPLKMINIWRIFIYFIIIQQKGYFHISKLILRLCAIICAYELFPLKANHICGVLVSVRTWGRYIGGSSQVRVKPKTLKFVASPLSTQH